MNLSYTSAVIESRTFALSSTPRALVQPPPSKCLKISKLTVGAVAVENDTLRNPAGVEP